ncbi:RNA polymerase subunit sigma-70 [Amycolatopsis australiensis]|uniref:RNA polymerase sigma factor n=1 Tax=Amycolatopsis australiensis TaxID=546364 RepID=A0A1K1QBV1_9PSEU|nr:RNA polymerase subunit sigma-70 [Amycolatopsis australiensis]SFW57391.1 RNA polymerase sigma-70 factor, ECF subfamily [Amycolatopsis australiensis]
MVTDTMDETEFAELTERHRRELRVHCYRFLGSLDEAEDLVQETFLRAWRGRDQYAGRASVRAWLYRIATNACLDFLDRTPRVVPSVDLPVAVDSHLAPRPAAAVPWLQPAPDDLLEDAISRETVELTFLAAVQYLSPRQRAVLILRDVVGWSAKETAIALETTPASVNSSLQRARAELKEQLPSRRTEWRVASSGEERAVVSRYISAITAADETTLAKVLRDDVRCSHQPGAGGHDGPHPTWYGGRATVLEGWAPVLRGPMELSMIPTRANGVPAVATYLRHDGRFHAFALNVLRVADGQVAEVTTFAPAVFPAFGLPPVPPEAE